MNSSIVSFNNILAGIESQVAQLGTLPRADREDRIVAVDGQLTELENQVADFQMRNQYKFDKEIDEIESRALEVHSSLERLKRGNDVAPNQSKVALTDTSDQRRIQEQQTIEQADRNLAEAKAIALGLVKTAERMRDEINMIDDEVMLQQEKLVHINKQIKETQNITLQTKKAVRIITLTVNQDKFIKSLIVLVAVALFAIIGTAVMIRIKQNRRAALFDKSVDLQLDSERPIFTKLLIETEKQDREAEIAKSNSEIMLDKVGLREADFYPWLEVPFGVPRRPPFERAAWEPVYHKTRLRLATPAKVAKATVVEPEFEIFKTGPAEAKKSEQEPFDRLKIPDFGTISKSAKDQL